VSAPAFLWFLASLSLFNDTPRALFTLVPRRTILRSVLGPVAAIPILVGALESVALNSGQMMFRGLAITLLVVGGTWLGLPARREYGRPLLMRLRRGLGMLPFAGFVICVLVVCTLCALVPEEFVRLVSLSALCVAQWVRSEPVWATCVMVLAIALLWWRCERKFRYFEPSAFPSAWNRSGKAW